MRLSTCAASVLAPLLVAGTAYAHLELDSPTPHFVFDNNGIEQTPCGSGTVSTAVNPPLVGGATLTVKWHETINHDGHYRIGLSANQSDFTVPTSLTIPTALPSWDLVDGIPDTSKGNGTFSKDITIPNISCPHCVLQVVQIASLSSDGSNTGGYYTNYYECADLVITASGASGSGGASGGGTGGAAATGTGGVTGAGTGGHIAGTGGAKAGTGGVAGTGTGGAVAAGTGTGGATGAAGHSGTGGEIAVGGTGGETGAAGHSGIGGAVGTDAGTGTSGSSSGCSYGAGAPTGVWLLLAAGLLTLLARRARRRSR
jgi:hypothetical protein